MSEVKTAATIIEECGGLSKLARELGCPVTTVQGWKERNRIPPERWRRIIDVAGALGKRLETDDFLPAEAAKQDAAA